MMPVARLGRYELRRFRGTLPKLALLFVLLVPLLYSALYLSASWDPYGKVDRLPVAVVNEDRAPSVTDAAGKEQQVTAGQDLVDNLLAEPAFDWQVTDAAEAAEGLREGRYFMTMTIPSSFSGDVEAGLSSATFDLGGNVSGGDARAGLDDAAKTEILRIMKKRRLRFDEARRVYMEQRFSANGIGADGRPRDPKFVSLS